MKKNFFKKLSFVLALAMIVTALAPAAGAFAAKAPKLNATEKYLYLDVDGKNEYDFNISNKQTGWKYLWSSANEDVATVNKKNGVTTATGAGKTKISVVITDKKGEEFDELTATVIVRDNIKELTITNLPADNKVAVGVEHDFNRSYVTVAKKTKGTSGITRWSVGEGATISDSGVFTATKAGEYTITARAFQSKAKYASWLADATKYASYVTAEATYKVTVAASMLKAEQVDLNTFKVTFDSPVADAATKLSVANIIGTTKVNQLIKEVKLSDDKTVATVDLYVDFSKESTYVVNYPEMKEVQFVAATAKVADVVRMEITTSTVELATEKAIVAGLYNKDGVNLASGVTANTDLTNRITWKSSSNSAYLGSGTNLLTMFKVGDTTTVSAEFHTYNYDTTTGKEVGNLTAEKVITCVEKSAASVGALNTYTLATSAPGNFKTVKQSVAASDANLKIYVQLKGKESDGTTDKYTDNLANNTGFKFSTNDTNILIVGETSGTVYPVKEGSGVVIIKYNDVVVGAATVTVTGARKVATISVDANTFTLSNSPNVTDVKNVELTVKDQLGDDFSSFTASVTLNNGPATASALLTDSTLSPVDKVFGFSAISRAEGTYSYTVTVTDTTNQAKYSTYVVVNVKAPSSADVHYYAIETSKTEYDMKIGSSDASYTETVTVSLFGYASNGVRTLRVPVVGGSNVVTLTKPDGTTAPLALSGTDATFELVGLTSGGTIIDKGAKGTYKLSAVNATGTAINATYFAVVDTQEAATGTVKKQFTTQATILAAVNDCITVTLKGDTKTVASLGDIDVAIGSDTGKSVFIKNVYVNESIGGSTLRHKVEVNTTINYAQ